MAVNLTSADLALKSYYLDAIAEQLDKSVNPFYAMIKKSEKDVYGKDVKKLVTCGVNGGVGAGAEDGELPQAGGNLYKELTLTLKNLYGTVEISDKAVRAAAGDAGRFVNLLSAEMDGLLKSAKYNFGRMLFGDGSGKLATVKSITGGVITVDSAKYLEENMKIDFFDMLGDPFSPNIRRRIVSVDKEKNTFRVDGAVLTETAVPADSTVGVQGAGANELTGLKALFGDSMYLYGLNRSQNAWLKPYEKAVEGDITELDIQTALDDIEERCGSKIDLILCSLGVRRALQKMFSEQSARLESMELAGGYKAMSYNGIPIVADRFCDGGTMYLVNTADFTLCQLCDWQWLEGEDGSVLRQVPGKPVYSATLVKYADLLCERPCGQGRITGITEI